MLRRIAPGLLGLGILKYVGIDEVSEQLAGHPHVNELLGDYYRQLAESRQLTEDLLPFDWDSTESDLETMAGRVAGYSIHQPIRTGQPASDIYATLAEIEGFAWLLEQDYDPVEALPYRAIRGGTTPDVRCYRGSDVSLYEIKSFMAYWERRRYPLKTIGTNSLVFGEPPVGRSVPDAERRFGLALQPGEYNSLLVRLTVEGLLGKARRQLTRYSANQNIKDCPKGVLLVITRYGSPPPLIREALRVAKAWHARRPEIATVMALPEDVWNAFAAGI